MKSFKMIASATLLTSAGFVGAVMADDNPPAVPATPAPVFELVSAQPFVLQQSYRSSWFKGGDPVTAGYVVVLSVDPALAYPRNVLMPVLYGGDVSIEPINHGHQSGKVVAIIPSPVNDAGKVSLDLTKTPIWYGTPELPERVDAAKVTGEKALANQAGIKPFSAEKVAAALKTGGEQVTLADQKALLAHLAPTLIKYSPQDTEQANQYLGILPGADKPAATPPATKGKGK